MRTRTCRKHSGSCAVFLISYRQHWHEVNCRGETKRFCDVFRKIVRGGADQSYGIEVAKLAGVPDRVIRRAHQILEELESGQPAAPAAVPAQGQISLLDLGGQTVLKKLEMTDVNVLSPIEALNLLAELKEDLRG